MSTGQVAELFGVAPETVGQWADDGKLPCFKTPGGQRRFLFSDIAPFLPDTPEPSEASA